MCADVLRGGNHKAESTASRVVAKFARLRLHQSNNAINQRARREILPCAGFFFVGVFLKQAFIQIAETFFTRRIPIEGVNRRNNFFKISGLVNVRLCALINFLNKPRAVFAQMFQQFHIKIFQSSAAVHCKIFPTITGGNIFFCAGLLRHFQK